MAKIAQVVATSETLTEYTIGSFAAIVSNSCRL